MIFIEKLRAAHELYDKLGIEPKLATFEEFLALEWSQSPINENTVIATSSLSIDTVRKSAYHLLTDRVYTLPTVAPVPASLPKPDVATPKPPRKDNMITLFFDTETDGMLRFRDADDHPDQPRLLQLAMILADEQKTWAEVNLLVHAERPVPEEVFRIHGISEEMSKKYGVVPQLAAAMFNSLARTADQIVCHNVDFDIRIMKAQFARMKRDVSDWNSKPTYCTMKKATPVLRIASDRGGFKWPKLQEAYMALVDPAGFEGAHDALADVRACRAVYNKLIEGGHV